MLTFRRNSILIWALAWTLSVLLWLGLWRAEPQFLAPPVLAQTPVLRFVDEDGNDLKHQTMRILCYASPSALSPSADQLFTTNMRGYLQQSLPPDCLYVAALQVIHQQPSGKPGRGDAYWVYNTSWPTGTRHLHAASGPLIITSTQHLVLFDLAATLEWTPALASNYRTDLYQGLFLASGNLYDLTEGQMAIGPVDLTSGGTGWNGADIRIRAANDYRPTAQVGGIVSTSIPYTTPNGRKLLFTPGEIWLSRYWDGFGKPKVIPATWTQPAAFRTIVHEWMHYALFLYDEYQDINKDGRAETYCACKDLPDVGSIPGACGGISQELAASAMAYHYTATELWHTYPVPAEVAACAGADHYQTHGETDWETLARWSQIQGLAESWLRKPTTVTIGPDLGLAGDLFGRRPTFASDQRAYLPLIQNNTPIANQPQMASVPLAAFLEITRSVKLNDEARSQRELYSLHPQLYTLQPATALQPARILHQGTTVDERTELDDLGAAPLLGVQTGTQVRLFLDRYGPAEAVRGHYLYTDSLDASDDHPMVVAADPWHVSLNVIPGMDGPHFRTLTVTLASTDVLPIAPTVHLCTPDATAGCPDDLTFQKTFLPTSPMTWVTTFTAPPGGELPHYGILSIRAPGVGERMRWFQTLGGAGPIHRPGLTPMRDGVVMVDTTTLISGTENMALIMPSANDAAVHAPLPLGIGGLIGLPYDVDVVMAPGQSDREPLPVPVVLTLFYSQEIVDRLNVAEAQLQLLYFDQALGTWEVVERSGFSRDLNWLATQPLTQTGNFAIGWSQPPLKVADPGPVQPGELIQYQIAMPASASLTQTSEALIEDKLPPGTLFAGNLHCTPATGGGCEYDPASNTVRWTGLVEAGDRVTVHFDLTVDPRLSPTACPPQVQNRALAFDGQTEHLLTSLTLVQCPTPVPALAGVTATFVDQGNGLIPISLQLTDSNLNAQIYGLEIDFVDQTPPWNSAQPVQAPPGWAPMFIPGNSIGWVTDDHPLIQGQTAQFVAQLAPTTTASNSIWIRLTTVNHDFLGYIVSQRTPN